jgi:hypothetical protein
VPFSELDVHAMPAQAAFLERVRWQYGLAKHQRLALAAGSLSAGHPDRLSAAAVETRMPFAQKTPGSL